MDNSEELFQRFGRKFSKGTVLFEDGDNSTEMYIIQSGRVEISKKVRDIKKTLVVLAPGEFFGEMATLNSLPRSARATVIEDSELLVIDPGTFEAMIANSHEVALRMIKKLVERVQEADNQIETLLLRDNASKVVTTIIRLALGSGDKTDKGIEIGITMKKLATLVGIDMETTVEIVNKLAKEEIVTESADSITVMSIERLTEFMARISAKETRREA